MTNSENTASQAMVFMELKEITNQMVFSCGEEHKFPMNGKNIKVMIISHSKNQMPLKKKIKNQLNNSGLTLNKDKQFKENQFMMFNGGNELK